MANARSCVEILSPRDGVLWHSHCVSEGVSHKEGI